MIQLLIQLLLCMCIIALGYYSYTYNYTFQDTVIQALPSHPELNDIEIAYFNISRIYTIGITIVACVVVLFTPLVAKKYFHDFMNKIMKPLHGVF